MNDMRTYNSIVDAVKNSEDVTIAELKLALLMSDDMGYKMLVAVTELKDDLIGGDIKNIMKHFPIIGKIAARYKETPAEYLVSLVADKAIKDMLVGEK